MYCMCIKFHAVILNCLLMVTRQLPGPACTELSIHMLIDCMLYQIPQKREGLRQIHCNFSLHITRTCIPRCTWPVQTPPQNTNLVSEIYWFHQCEFSKPITVELQHCAKPSQISSLRFARCSKIKVSQYNFEIFKKVLARLMLAAPVSVG